MRNVIIAIIIVAVSSVGIWRSCRYDWNPHFIGNDAVTLDSSLFNSDSSAAVVYYNLDIGARGLANYQTMLRKDDYKGDLSKFLIPNEYILPKWKGTDTLEVVFDEYQGMGGPLTGLNKNKDTVMQNEIVIIVKERKMNKQEMIERDMRYYK